MSYSDNILQCMFSSWIISRSVELAAETECMWSLKQDVHVIASTQPTVSQTVYAQLMTIFWPVFV